MERLRKHSKKRDAILNCIAGTKCHPTAEWVYQQLKPEYPDLSLGTVYRNLAMFKREGTIGSVCIEDGLERFDRTAEPHAHFICQHCNAVIDVETPIAEDAFANIPLPGAAREFSLTFYGVCDNCK